jgi:glycosyltransferase involved in cell wall biosynthesis
VPTVSVIIPTYNRAEMVREAVQSVLDQTYRDHEIVVVDDGSTDNTRAVLEEMSGRCASIRYVYQENRGRSAARNRALGLARGRYIAFLDSDDLFLPRKLEIQVAEMEKSPQYGMTYCSAICTDEHGKEQVPGYTASASGWIYRQLAFYVPLTVILPTVMVRAEVMSETGGFDESMERFEDTDMWRRVARRTPVLAIQEPLCKVRTHAENELGSQDPEAILRAVEHYVSKVFDEDRDQGRVYLRRGASRFYFYYGMGVATQPGWRRLGRPFILRSIWYWPLQMWGYMMLVAITFGDRGSAMLLGAARRLTRVLRRGGTAGGV